MSILFICATIAGSGGVINLSFATTLRSFTVGSGTIFGIIGTIFCITLGGVTLGVVNFLVIVGVTYDVEQEYFVAYTLGRRAVGDGSDVSFFWGKS